MSLIYQDSSLMDGLGLEPFLMDSCLKSLVQKFVEGQTQYVIELELLMSQETISVHSSKKGGAFE